MSFFVGIGCMLLSISNEDVWLFSEYFVWYGNWVEGGGGSGCSKKRTVLHPWQSLGSKTVKTTLRYVSIRMIQNLPTWLLHRSYCLLFYSLFCVSGVKQVLHPATGLVTRLPVSWNSCIYPKYWTIIKKKVVYIVCQIWILIICKVVKEKGQKAFYINMCTTMYVRYTKK